MIHDGDGADEAAEATEAEEEEVEWWDGEVPSAHWETKDGEEEADAAATIDRIEAVALLAID